jgi:hypothetical protein
MGIDYVNSSCNEAFCSSRLLSEDYVPIHPTLKDTGIILSADNPIDLPVNSFNMEITQKVIDRYSSAIDSRALEYAKMINLVHN